MSPILPVPPPVIHALAWIVLPVVTAGTSTVVIRGALYGTNQKFALVVEQSNDSLDYDQAGAETLVEHIEDDIIALTDLSGATPAQIDFTGVTCTVKTTLELA